MYDDVPAKELSRVERAVSFVRGAFFAGEELVDLGDAQRRVERWCRHRAGMNRAGASGSARPPSVPRFVTLSG